MKGIVKKIADTKVVRTMSNVLGIVIVLLIIAIAVRLGVMNANTASTLLVIGPLLFVIRPITDHFLMYWVEFRLSMNPSIRKELEKYLFVRDLDSPTETHLNPAVPLLVHGTCWAIFIGVSFLLWTFQNISGDLVYYTLRDTITLVGLLAGTAGERLLAFLEVILLVTTIVSGIIPAYNFVKGKLRSLTPVIVFGISLPVHEMYHWVLFQYSGWGELWFRIWPKLIILVITIIVVLMLALTENDGNGSGAPSGLSV